MRPVAVPPLRLPPTQRSFRGSIAVSAAAHAAVALVVLWVAEAVQSATSPAAGRPAAPGGGAAIRYIALPPYQAPRAPDPPATARQVAPLRPRVEIRDAAPSLAAMDAAHVSLASVAGADPDLSRSGAGRGGGTGGGTTAGAGPGGAGGDTFPPQARYSILPPLPRPAAVRGQSFRVHFWVDATGHVTRVAVSPPIPDTGYRKQFLALMAQYTFTPALKPDGTATSGETVLTITL
jgi:hypothetical protein